MLFSIGASFVANTSASIVGVVTVGLVTMKYLFRNYPNFPNSNLATYPVAAIKGCRIENRDKGLFTVQFQIFYPCVVNAKKKNQTVNTYMRESALEGLCRTLGNNKASNFFLRSVLKDKISTHLFDGSAENVLTLNTSLSSSKNSADTKWPVVMFSHGLFGSMEEYSTICKDIASHGFVVVAPEHEDGSASYAETAAFHNSKKTNTNQKNDQIQVLIDDGSLRWDSSQGKDEFFEKYVIPYKKPEGVTYNQKDSVVSFRRPFLQKRYDEICDLIEALVEVACDNKESTKPDNSNSASNDTSFLADKDQLKAVLLTTNLIDPESKSVHLAGHSFGGCTVQYMMNQLNNDSTSKMKGIHINSLLLLDTWVSPVSNEVLSQRFSIPTLSIFCETFVTWTPTKVLHELNGVEKMLQANTNSVDQDKNNELFHCVAIRGTKHQFFSDVPYWFPKFFVKHAGVSGETDIEISRSCLEKLVAKFLLKDRASKDVDLTSEEMSYVYQVDEKMLNAPRI